MFPPSLCPAETRSSLFSRHTFFVLNPLAVDGKQLCSERRQKAETFQWRSSTKAAFVAPLSPSHSTMATAERTSSIKMMTFLCVSGRRVAAAEGGSEDKALYGLGLKSSLMFLRRRQHL